MAIPVWPTSLPQFFLRGGYKEGFKNTVLRSPMDSGPTKTRQRFTNSPTVLDGAMPLTDDQVATFKTFYEDDLGNGGLSFTIFHPRLGGTVTVQFTEDPRPLVPEGALSYILQLKLKIQI